MNRFKFLSFSILCMLVPVVAQATGPTLELKSGTMLAGGTVAFSRVDDSSETDTYKSEEVTTATLFSPTIGYFITPTIALTGSVTLGVKSREYKRTDKYDSSWYSDTLDEEPLGLSAGLRFLIPTGGRLCAYVGGEIEYTRITSEYRDENSLGDADYDCSAESVLYGVNLIGGILYSLTTHVAIDVGLKVSYQKGDYEINYANKTTELENTGFSLGYLGLMAFF